MVKINIEGLSTEVKKANKVKTQLNPPATSVYATASSPAFVHDMKKKSESGIRSQVEEKLTSLFGKSCSLHGMGNKLYVISFSPEQSYETLQECSSKLQSAGIDAIATTPCSLQDGLVKIPAKIEIKIPIIKMELRATLDLDYLLKKLSVKTPDLKTESTALKPRSKL